MQSMYIDYSLYRLLLQKMTTSDTYIHCSYYSSNSITC